MAKINKKAVAAVSKKIVEKGKKSMKNGTNPFKKTAAKKSTQTFKKKTNKKHGKEKEILKKTDESTEDFSEEESDKENASDISFTMSDAENLTDSELETKDEADDPMSDDSDDDDDHEAHDEEEKHDEGEESESEAEEDHKKALERLKETDPEFYKYLEENDKKLLNFNLSDAEDDDDDDEGGDEEIVHKPSGELEIASDESDFEPEGEEDRQVDSRVITLKMLKQWQADIQTDKTNKTMICLMQAFNAALARVMSNEEEVSTFYKVDGSAVFNAVIQICVLELGPAIRRFLGLKPGSKQAPHKCKKFIKINSMVKGYFTDLFKLLTSVTSTNILNILLKHLHYMSPMIVSFGSISKPLLKKLIQIWGTADESVRVVAFLCILRITHNQQQAYLDTVLKSMYMTYVKNSKFVSVNTLPGINFMRRSLVEIYSLDLNVSYTHVFLYIRQLAIQLRTAITMKKKENLQAVYNWQFINSLKLWGNLLGTTCNKPQLQPLVYPFVQVCMGTIKLSPNPAFYPLRFHITKALVDLSKETQVFIPVMPFLLEVLTGYNFNKEHKKVSMKPLNFVALLRLSKNQLTENGFKDGIIENIYGQLLEYLSSQSQSIAFPELALLCKIHLKEFMKQCHNVNYQRKMTQILEKINQNSEFINKERKKVNLPLKQFKQIDAWETSIRNSGTPLNTYYETWSKMTHIKKKKQVTNNEELGDYNLPKLKKVKKTNESKEENGEVTLFPSDSEDDDLVMDKDETKKDVKKRGARGSKKGKKSSETVKEVEEINGEGDVVEDFKLDDW